MAHRTKSQKIGSRGHKWLLAHVEKHPQWLTRDLSEDFGVDMEFELAGPDLLGEIIKVQIKSTTNAEHKDGNIKFHIDRKYVEYAASCRYPVVFVLVDIETESAWYLWLQEWLLLRRIYDSPLREKQDSWVEWVAERKSIQNGLDGELKSIAKWEGQTQLVLSLLDALHSAVAVQNQEVVEALTTVIEKSSAQLGDAPLNVLIDKAIALGNRMRGTQEGNAIADQLFSIVRKFGGRISIDTVAALVIRGDSYSRAGFSALAILYDEFPGHIKSLRLPEFFLSQEPRVAYYCAFRENFPDENSSNVFADPSGFTYAGLKYVQPETHWDKYANRGPSALLDYLVLQNEA
ncbi:MAG: DUF4365 domain-containing protein [Gammaproteobacteria bacterium]|nr:DUF4365 domain-containing protein [Gammaproteobacteria bacterium]